MHAATQDNMQVIQTVSPSILPLSTDDSESGTRFPTYTPGKNAADVITPWQDEKLAEHPTEKRSKAAFLIPKAYRTHYEAEYEPWEAAARYYAEFPAFAPRKFQTSTRQRKKAAEKALSLNGWAYKLFKQLEGQAFFYSLSMANLGLPGTYADSRFVYYPLVVAEIKAAIEKHIPRPFAWKIEVGEAGNTHVHIIGPFAPALANLYFPGSVRFQPVKRGTEKRLTAYMLKPAAIYTEENYRNFLEARRDKQTVQLPRLSGQLWVKKPRKRRKVEWNGTHRLSSGS